MNTIKSTMKGTSPRGVVLGGLGVVTLGVALLSVAVSYGILKPAFGGWAVPTVGALDALWVIFQATEILAGNRKDRVERVRNAGLALTAVNAAIPTAHLILAGATGTNLAVILTPVAIVATKGAWWLTLRSLGRRTSVGTRQTIGTRRQEVADHLETMEAEAAHRIELLETATALEGRVAEAETEYRLAVLTAQQNMTERLHAQATATAQTVATMPLPESVAAIVLPELGQWTPAAPALAVTAGRVAAGPALSAVGSAPAPETGAQVSAGESVTPSPVPRPVTRLVPQTEADLADPAPETGAPRTTTPETAPEIRTEAGADGAPDAADPAPESGAPRTETGAGATLEEIAAVEGVPVPKPGERLTDPQIRVVLVYLRWRQDPPLESARQALAAFRAAGYVGAEDRVRPAWGALVRAEGSIGAEGEDEEQPGPRQ